MLSDIEYMKMALGLAAKGVGFVEPNPAVGAVVVKDGKIIGKGFHEKFGGPHAEINAFADCKKNGYDPVDATMYVTLEPCCHFGKTGPCTEAMIKAGIQKVFAAMKDPTGKVAGRGFEILKQAGIKVEVGLCSDDAIKLNSAFVHFAWTSLPWVVVKWAQSSDGFLSRTDGKRWITNQISRADVQKIRASSQAILVGINTVIEDDPMLTSRSRADTGILRIVLDSNLRISLSSQLLKSVKNNDVLVLTSEKTLRQNLEKAESVRQAGAEVVAIENANGQCNLAQALDVIGQKGVQQLLVEGGVEVISSFIDDDFCDEAVIYVTAEKLESAGAVKVSPQMGNLLCYCRGNGQITKFATDQRIRSLLKET